MFACRDDSPDGGNPNIMLALVVQEAVYGEAEAAKKTAPAPLRSPRRSCTKMYRGKGTRTNSLRSMTTILLPSRKSEGLFEELLEHNILALPEKK